MNKVCVGDLKSFFFYLLCKTVSLFKVSCVIGSTMHFFSVGQFLYPLAGKVLNKRTIFYWFFLGITIRLLTGTCCSLLFLTGTPSLCSALYASRKFKVVLGFVIPAACMVLFLFHPVGRGAAPYAFYWIIPIVIMLLKKRYIFLDMLGATFVAHSVGSVCWLYLFPTTSLYWLSIMPLVAIERLIFACGSYVIYEVAGFVVNFLRKNVKSFANKGVCARLQKTCQIK